ncbi:Hypothetical protein Y17_2639 [Pectobacterium wasabiae CFBP 3304]|nr:Hypothetical protein Y17_2639 [Pectobacterium wasabiae CFBP 3304]
MEQIIGINLVKQIFQVHIVSVQGEKKANKMMPALLLKLIVA